MQDLKLFFAHVGKTGGTSLRHAAYQHFGRARCVCLYGEGRSGNTGGAFEAFSAALGRGATREAAAEAVIDLARRERAAFLSTHELDLFAPRFPAEKTATLVRDPVERTLSLYNFWRRLGRELPPFEAFIEEPRFRNVQARALRNLDLDAIAAVGVTERYAESVALFNRRFGVALPALRRNRTWRLPWRASKARVGAAVARRIEQLNAEDMALHARALRRLDSDLVALEA